MLKSVTDVERYAENYDICGMSMLLVKILQFIFLLDACRSIWKLGDNLPD